MAGGGEEVMEKKLKPVTFIITNTETSSDGIKYYTIGDPGNVIGAKHLNQKLKKSKAEGKLLAVKFNQPLKIDEGYITMIVKIKKKRHMPKITTAEAVQKLQKELKKESLRVVYRANISMCMYDELCEHLKKNKKIAKKDFLKMADAGAERFLKLFCEQ